MKHIGFILLIFILAGCVPGVQSSQHTSCEYARYFDLIYSSSDSTIVQGVVVISPFSGQRDTLPVDGSMDRIVCMSSSHVASMSAIGADSLVAAVSGLRYISDPDIHAMQVPDVGYENSLDYETILKISPDLLVAYTVAGGEPQHIAKLRSLGVRVLILYDHLEEHPLARAEYVRLFGALTGRLAQADTLFSEVCSNYLSLVVPEVSDPLKILMNIPYGDAWYVPGGDSYMSRLVRDAGGMILGSVPGQSHSGTVSLEEAFLLAKEAQIWLNPGLCRTQDELKDMHKLFAEFGPISSGRPIYNNVKRMTPGGGNDFWESGSTRPDLILKDLRAIIDQCSVSGDGPETDSLEYFCKVRK